MQDRWGPAIRVVPPRPAGATPALDESQLLFAKFVSRPDHRLQYAEAQLARRRGDTDEAAYKTYQSALEGRLTQGAGAFFAAMKPDLQYKTGGSFGTVLVYRATTRVREALRGLRADAERSGNFVHGLRDVRSGLVAVKIQPIGFLEGGDSDDPRSRLWFKVRENVIHAYLSQSECRLAPDGTKWCARDVVPELYWAGQLYPLNMVVSVMEGVDGKTVYRSQSTDPELGAKIEKATHTLWAYGVLHNDLHASNVLVDKLGQLKIIDFGRATYTPKLAVSPSVSMSASPMLSRMGSGRSSLFRSASGRYAPTAAQLRSPSMRQRVELAADEESREDVRRLYHANLKMLKAYGK